jgi:hypothetical protein
VASSTGTGSSGRERNAKGQFMRGPRKDNRKPNGTRVMARVAKRAGMEPRVVQRSLDLMAQKGTAGLWNSNRKRAVAIRKTRDALVAELGSNAPPSAQAMADLIAKDAAALDTLDRVLGELGTRIVDRKRAQARPLLMQRRELADSLAAHLRAFSEMKANTELERRLAEVEAALEEARHVVRTTSQT